MHLPPLLLRKQEISFSFESSQRLLYYRMLPKFVYFEHIISLLNLSECYMKVTWQNHLKGTRFFKNSVVFTLQVLGVGKKWL